MENALIIIGCIGLLILWILLWPFVIMIAWNAFIPAVLGGPVITYWQAFAGWILVNVIGGAFRSVVSK